MLERICTKEDRKRRIKKERGMLCKKMSGITSQKAREGHTF